MRSTTRRARRARRRRLRRGAVRLRDDARGERALVVEEVVDAPLATAASATVYRRRSRRRRRAGGRGRSARRDRSRPGARPRPRGRRARCGRCRAPRSSRRGWPRDTRGASGMPSARELRLRAPSGAASTEPAGPRRQRSERAAMRGWNSATCARDVELLVVAAEQPVIARSSSAPTATIISVCTFAGSLLSSASIVGPDRAEVERVADDR